ncbi:MAG TPA: PadR family transcriptional regulator [Candidatus Saccharimonadia bacterium]|nr:PadR family transcriptional regulator [Candidatus Saccharimonadia bacterium]
MNITIPEEILPLTPQMQHILAALALGSMNGYEVIQQAREDAGGIMRLGPSTVYPALKKLRGMELVKLDEHYQPSGRGRSECAYELTPTGRHVLQAEIKRQTELAELVRARLAAK